MNKPNRVTVVGIVGIIFIILGLGLILWFPPKELIHKLVFGAITEIGFAAVIAWAVAFILEKHSRDEYNQFTQEKAKLISQNVFGYLYGVHLSRKTFASLEKYIFKKPVIKTFQRLDYELESPMREHPEWLKMRCEYDYTLKNLSHNTVEHPLIFHVSSPVDSSTPTVSGIGLQSVMIGGERIQASEFNDLDKAEENPDGQIRFRKSISIAADASVRVRVVFCQLKRVTDNDLYKTNLLTENFELNLRYDPEIYDTHIQTVHPEGEFDTDVPAANGVLCRTVTHENLMLPQNGVFMWWTLRNQNRENIDETENA